MVNHTIIQTLISIYLIMREKTDGRGEINHFLIPLREIDIGDFMDVLFEFFLPKNIDLKVLGWKEVYIEWGGGEYSYDPKLYKWNDLISFEFNKEIQCYERLLGKYICLDDYFSYTLKGSLISELEWCVNKNTDEKNNLMSLFVNKFLNEIKYWTVLTLVDGDQFDEVYEIDSNTDAFSIIKKSLDWNDPKGIALIKKDR
ncbi:hypothetical protein ABRQ07_20395 [Pectobacterium polonicum]|uniref:Uncharacterized protein n=1 Tax=Pectobacterium polonicum TaxID=2485124 RepID=A0ABV1PFL6_9GAMM|nr:hypothetical protein [Pectobacterium polonicum]MDC9821189.1 hypothetical protein [Pectobacterium polonicum]